MSVSVNVLQICLISVSEVGLLVDVDTLCESKPMSVEHGERHVHPVQIGLGLQRSSMTPMCRVLVATHVCDN